MHNPKDPLAFTMYDDWINRVNIRFKPEDMKQTMAWIQERFKAADPNYVFEYFFVDDLFAQMYQREEQLNKLTLAAAAIAIIISFMGLFALASLSIQKRVKEIGIRKTLGASVSQLLVLLFREMWLWVAIGCLLAWPLSVFVILRWLENFHFVIRIVDHWYLFVLAGLLAIITGTIAVFSHAWSAGNANPVESLKGE